MDIQKNNFFTLFGLPIDFLIDKSVLKARFLDLQKRHHPDNNQTGDAEEISSLINHAYNQLISDDRRALYLLELSGIDTQLETSITDLEFLDEMMDIRMDLDDANQLEQILSLQKTVFDKLHIYCQKFDQAYQKKHWQIATEIAQKLHFLSNLNNSITLKQSNLNHQSDDIDDLYV